MAQFAKPPAGVVLIEPQVWLDDRGGFQETWRRNRYRALGIAGDFLQDNLAWSHTGTLRGLHYQFPSGQGKLVYALQGEVFDVCVDVRRDSPTFGDWFPITLSQANRRQVFVPAGFAHGYLVTSGPALVAYKCTSYYAPDCERTIAWHDPAIGIDWPIPPTLISAKDQLGCQLEEIPKDHLPRVAPPMQADKPGP